MLLQRPLGVSLAFSPLTCRRQPHSGTGAEQLRDLTVCRAVVTEGCPSTGRRDRADLLTRSTLTRSAANSGPTVPPLGPSRADPPAPLTGTRHLLTGWQGKGPLSHGSSNTEFQSPVDCSRRGHGGVGATGRGDLGNKATEGSVR